MEYDEYYANTFRSVDAPFEYGIRRKEDFEMHRTGFQTYHEASEWMSRDWDGMDPFHVFEIVRRPIGRWAATEE